MSDLMSNESAEEPMVVPTYADGIEAAAGLAELYDTGEAAAAALRVTADMARQVAEQIPADDLRARLEALADEWDAADEHGNPLREGSLGEAADELRAALTTRDARRGPEAETKREEG